MLGLVLTVPGKLPVRMSKPVSGSMCLSKSGSVITSPGLPAVRKLRFMAKSSISF